ncbi:N-acetylmuramic acid 6-phosphate etherase [Vibrio mimicus]|uniref:N-acetylmuramic acid 6-phosphate etherase n=1 Tax=Vibrio mimicus TaxID=674 RepID=UPI00076B7090|nr:N-acetylmuramic acid 6-phosphate etherase [Vibrio mimicus]AMG03230.1 N-acetylmuramic acid 6-phosphate etherase [Vibrio mimicus]
MKKTAIELSQLVTEMRNPQTMSIDEASLQEQLAIMNYEDQHVPNAVKEVLPDIENVITEIVNRYVIGGRVIYCGAGTSGRIGVLDAVETLPTFGIGQERFIPVLAGGINNFGNAGEDAEDDQQSGKSVIAEININNRDVVVGLSASGRTPYVIGAIHEAKKRKALTIAICCNLNSQIGEISDLKIEVDCGPEFLTGSTRLKAGTAQKLILNMISTISMLQIGKTYSNLMIDVEPTNEKLIERWHSLVKTVTGCSHERAKELFIVSAKSAKVAIIMELTGDSYERAILRLTSSGGFTKKALESLS